MTRIFEFGFFAALLVMIVSLMLRAGMQWSQSAHLANW